MIHASCGGVTHWGLAPDDDDSVMTVGWGQNAANGNQSLQFQYTRHLKTGDMTNR